MLVGWLGMGCTMWAMTKNDSYEYNCHNTDTVHYHMVYVFVLHNVLDVFV